MIAIRSEADLLACFRDIDRAEVDVRGLTFPLEVAPATAWTLGARGFVLFRDRAGGAAKGIVFFGQNGSTPEVPTMCNWCHRVRDHGGVKMLSVRCGERQWVGQYVCSDLSCVSESVEQIRSFAARRVF